MTVRMHGDVSFSQGGSAYDVYYVLKNYGICPEDAMPLPGTMYGDSLANFNEFFDVMTPYVEKIAKSDSKKLTPAWKNGEARRLCVYHQLHTPSFLDTVCC